MKFGALLSCMGCLLLAMNAGANPDDTAPADSSNPYTIISERNVFHLSPPPPPPAPDVPKPDLPIIKLSGFFKVGGAATRALFSSMPKDKKDAPIYYNLAEGEKEGILEVVKIHEDKGEVEIINSGTPATLTLKDDTLAGAETAPGKAGNEKPEANRRGPLPEGMARRGWHGREETGGPQPNTPFNFPRRPPRLPQ